MELKTSPREYLLNVAQSCFDAETPKPLIDAINQLFPNKEGIVERVYNKDEGVEEMPSEFEKKLEELINYHSLENGSDTPDFILAQYLRRCLENFNETVRAREKWYGRGPSPISDSPVE